MRRNGTLILCYHRVAEGVEDPFYLCIRPDNFAAHLEEVSRAREPSTLADVSVPSRRPTRCRSPNPKAYRSPFSSPAASWETTTVSGGTASEHCCARDHRT
jgi:hypothetical protein